MNTLGKLYQGDHAGVEALLLGRKVTKISDSEVSLDNGMILDFIGNDGGCSCGAGDYNLTALNHVDNVITKVEFVDDPGGDDYEHNDGVYQIFVYADNKKVNLVTFKGSDGNGYYGTGYSIQVSLSKVK